MRKSGRVTKLDGMLEGKEQEPVDAGAAGTAGTDIDFRTNHHR